MSVLNISGSLIFAVRPGNPVQPDTLGYGLNIKSIELSLIS